MDKKWYAVYTKPHWEKKVAESLSSQQFITYCPLTKTVHQWSDRKKTIYVPLFTSYVFVLALEGQLGLVKKTKGVINLVYWQGKPAAIRDQEIELIRNFLNEYSHVRLGKTPFAVNDTVKISSGSFIDQEGTIVAVKNQYAVVALPALGYTLYAEMEKSRLVKVAAPASQSVKPH
ncbi:UpxY family transcription antiterminator [Pontibacter sp. E15-1]|uniref:transcription termination/antitermination protein NusG n=1 Tax=Pontibacter sp. E15-1 TaxID=2919918 RepID=UPI001F4FA2BA|nr:UpxY family transcription antiterminator [Pontibacter sp. E15-1]MCJ8164118.1 UpxY family transcription antiterminator [Pontibacter sp. E15-1]